jgi:hypothetical protein
LAWWLGQRLRKTRTALRSGGYGQNVPKRIVAAVVGALLACLTIASCGSAPTKTLPNVIGMHLDDAHNALDHAGFHNHRDADALGKGRSMTFDSQWVVVKVEPAVATAKTSTTLTLDAARANQQELTGLLSPNTPIMKQFAAEAAAKVQAAKTAEANARQQAAAAAAQANTDRLNAVNDYIAGLMARDIDTTMGYLDQDAVAVSKGASRVTAAENFIAAKRLFHRAEENFLLTKPDDKADLDGVNGRLADAMALMSGATQAFLDALDTLAPTDIARWREDRSAGEREWNATLRTIYGSAHMKAPVYRAKSR